MKRINKALFVCGIVAVLTACGQNAAPVGNLAQDINIDAGNLGHTEKAGNNEDEMAEKKSEVSDQGKSEEEEEPFGFLYDGVTLIPGEVFDQSVLRGYGKVSEVPNCALGGSDKVYNYKMFELTAYIGEDGERIDSIYLIDSNLPTTEGLHLGDTVDDMKSLYGENYEAEGTAYTYTRGETLLTIITKNDIVVSIEYCLDR